MGIKNSLIRFGKRVLLNAGLDVRKASTAHGSLRTTTGQAYAQIKRLGFVPGTVIDVGVARGTAELYAHFGDAHLLLVEPLAQFEPDLKSILKRHRGSYVLAAAGATPGEVRFNVHDGHADGSSLYKESAGSHADGHEVVVPMVRLDDVVRERGLRGPFLIKVDVQGAELDVLDGCGETLRETEAVVLEVSMFEFMVGAPQFSDVIANMKERGFVPYDIILGWNRPLDNALGQVDVMFVREHGRFRGDHSYSSGSARAAREQLAEVSS